MKEEKKIRKKIKIEDLLPRDPVRVDLDAILDDIETVLETNAEEYVSSFVQKGGE